MSNALLVDYVMKNYIGYQAARRLRSRAGVLTIDSNTLEYYGTISYDYMTEHAINTIADDELVVVVKKGYMKHIIIYSITKLI